MRPPTDSSGAFRQYRQEMGEFGTVWVLELCDGRRVAVPIQISLPRCEANEVVEEHK